MAAALIDAYDAVVCDLDGVVYRGPEPIAGAVPTLETLRNRGTGIVYATNNASRPPADVADHLRELGLDVGPDSVLTSAMAGAAVLAERLGKDAEVLAVGGPGVRVALSDNGLRPVAPDAVTPAAQIRGVLQGYGPGVTAAELGQVAYAVQSGAVWVATNTDLTLPTDRGIAPGNGSLVAAVRYAVDDDPVVVGKPGALMYQMAARSLGASADRTIAVGDRLETDVAGATAAQMDAVHVLTGVHGPTDLLGAAADRRPRFVCADLTGLLETYDEPQPTDGRWTGGGWSAWLADAGDRPGPQLRVARGPVAAGSADVGDDSRPEGGASLGLLRVALRALWAGIDAGGLTVDQAVALWRTADSGVSA